MRARAASEAGEPGGDGGWRSGAVVWLAGGVVTEWWEEEELICGARVRSFETASALPPPPPLRTASEIEFREGECAFFESLLARPRRGRLERLSEKLRNEPKVLLPLDAAGGRDGPPTQGDKRYLIQSSTLWKSMRYSSCVTLSIKQNPSSGRKAKVVRMEKLTLSLIHI